MISVDLIENAFKHTDFLAPDSFISIHIELDERIFKLKISNKTSQKSSLQKTKGGFGSPSFEHRLKMIYNHHFQLERSTKNGVYTAQLTLNLGDFYDKMRYS